MFYNEKQLNAIKDKTVDINNSLALLSEEMISNAEKSQATATDIRKYLSTIFDSTAAGHIISRYLEYEHDIKPLHSLVPRVVTNEELITKLQATLTSEYHSSWSVIGKTFNLQSIVDSLTVKQLNFQQFGFMQDSKKQRGNNRFKKQENDSEFMTTNFQSATDIAVFQSSLWDFEYKITGMDDNGNFLLSKGTEQFFLMMFSLELQLTFLSIYFDSLGWDQLSEHVWAGLVGGNCPITPTAVPSFFSEFLADNRIDFVRCGLPKVMALISAKRFLLLGPSK